MNSQIFCLLNYLKSQLKIAFLSIVPIIDNTKLSYYNIQSQPSEVFFF